MNEKMYSEKELKRIWKKIQPTDIEREQLRLEALENDVRRLGSHFDILIKQISSIVVRLDKLESFGEEGEIELVKIPEKQATKKILDYIKTHPGSRTSDVIFELHLDPDRVLEILRKLEENKTIKGKDIE